jgi:hypothetical protein
LDGSKGRKCAGAFLLLEVLLLSYVLYDVGVLQQECGVGVVGVVLVAVFAVGAAA